MRCGSFKIRRLERRRTREDAMGCCMPCLKDARGDRPVEPPSRSVETTSLMSWVADDDELAATCYKCNTEFDAYVHRRHHCRRCGNGARACARARLVWLCDAE